MVRSLCKIFTVSLLFAAVLFGGYSCSDDHPDDYLSQDEVRRMIEEALRQNNEQFEFTKWEIVNITADNWIWNGEENFKRYEAVYELPALNEDIYKYGAVLGYIFIGTEGNEVQKLLPYVHTYEEAGEVFTETISFDVQYKRESDVNPEGEVDPSVAFFIQTSDLFGSEEFAEFLPAHNFRLVLIWK